ERFTCGISGSMRLHSAMGISLRLAMFAILPARQHSSGFVSRPKRLRVSWSILCALGVENYVP
ncbi:hypothetical protein, partial [Xanthomonas fragariae]|uniref:hypothetical protein n=1 Tax=Xanthomonas fragariae TaxID=48664 RepID=UPI001F1B999B